MFKCDMSYSLGSLQQKILKLFQTEIHDTCHIVTYYSHKAKRFVVEKKTKKELSHIKMLGFYASFRPFLVLINIL